MLLGRESNKNNRQRLKDTLINDMLEIIKNDTHPTISERGNNRMPQKFLNLIIMTNSRV